MNLLLTGHYSYFFKNENCFKEKHGRLHENLYVKFITLRNEFKKYGVNLYADSELNKKVKYSAIIVHDHPSNPQLLDSLKCFNGPKYLTTEEAPFILPQSFSIDRLKDYRLIFTNYVFQKNNPQVIPSLPMHIDREMALKLRLTDIPIEKKLKKVFVGTNKKPSEKLLPNANYHFRDKLLNWYSYNDPHNFDLYGSNWDRKFLNGSNLVSKIFNYHKLDLFLQGTEKKFSNLYKGKLISKYNSLGRYKFHFCIENCVGYEGYVTEKIFDAIVSRNLPVYYPCTRNSLDNILPDNIFINICDFQNINEINKFLDNMSINEYSDYISKIDNFVDYLPAYLHENYWAKNISHSIICDLQKINSSALSIYN